MIKTHYQAPAVNRKQVGDKLITMLSDGYLDVSFKLPSGITEHEPKPCRKGVARLLYRGSTLKRTIIFDIQTNP